VGTEYSAERNGSEAEVCEPVDLLGDGLVLGRVEAMGAVKDRLKGLEDAGVVRCNPF
jgi:hypothetical protein